MSRTLRRRRPALFVLCAIAALGALSWVVAAAPARTARAIDVHVRVAHTITRSADGTVTVRVTYTASDPRCFSGSWLKKLGDGYYHVDGTFLEYAQYGPHAIANPPGNGWLVPRKLGVSPSVWEAVWPGDAHVAVQGADSPVEDATVADATGVYLDIEIPRNNNHLNKYLEGGERVVVGCEGPEFDLHHPFP